MAAGDITVKRRAFVAGRQRWHVANQQFWSRTVKREPMCQKNFKNEVPIAAAERGNADFWSGREPGRSLVGTRGRCHQALQIAIELPFSALERQSASQPGEIGRASCRERG